MDAQAHHFVSQNTALPNSLYLSRFFFFFWLGKQESIILTFSSLDIVTVHVESSMAGV